MNQEVFLSVVVPVYNEEEIIEESLLNVLNLLHATNDVCELILVNDASTDNSEKRILTVIQSSDLSGAVTYLINESNLGFGGAVKKGIAVAKGQNVLCLPVDLHIETEQVDEIIALLKTNDVVACYRESKPGNSFVSVVGSAIYQGLIRLMYDVKVRDLNWVHAYRKSVFTEAAVKSLSNRIFFLAEVLILARQKNLRITEMPLPQQLRENKKGTSQSFGTFVNAMGDLLAFMFR